MTASRTPIRFGLQIDPTAVDLNTIGVEAERAGFDVISVPDHVGPNFHSPMLVLAQLAASTSTIGLATMVCNNDMRNPVQLAWEAATLQVLSGGRFELGIGAGHTPTEYAATGIQLDQPMIRKKRLTESVELVGQLLRGMTTDFAGTHYTVVGADIPDTDQPVPLLVGGNGKRLLTHAAAHADAIGLQGLGRTGPDGHKHSVRWDEPHLDQQLTVIAEASESRSTERGPLELAALVQRAELADDRERALAPVVDRADGLTMNDALTTPYLAVGTADELAAQFLAARQRWGITYFTVRSLELGPVIARTHQLDQRR